MLCRELRLLTMYSLTLYIDFTKAFCVFRVLYSYTVHV
jgi:hypothetical protein